MTTTSARYRLLEADEIDRYLAERRLTSVLGPPDTPSHTTEVSDGNLNRVFIVRRSKRDPGIVLKQALPWVRVHGEDWPLTPERAAREAHAYAIYQPFAAEYIPRVFGYDDDRHILAMEDLGNLFVLREALNRCLHVEGVAGTIGRFVARVAFHTSDLGLPPTERKLLAARSVNPELCKITEDVVMSEPYVEHEHNRNAPAIDALASELRRDGLLRAEVAALKYKFMTKAEALVHGDLHSGSIMVGDSRTVVIDPEFCFYGPVGFDLGVFWGNCAIAFVRAALISAPTDFVLGVGCLIAESWTAFTEEISRLWQGRVDESFDAGFRARFRRDVWRDGLGFAGTEAMRRVIGYAHVSDVETLPGRERGAAAAAIARISRQLILGAGSLSNPADVMALVNAEIRCARDEFGI